MKKVSVIIPNYNGIDFLKPCFDALNQQDITDFDVILVDNGSEDGSVDVAAMYSTNFPLQIIQLDSNYGFSKAVNEGIKASNSEYVILLNNDTKAGRHFVKELLARIEGQDDIFSAQALMLQYDNRHLVDSAGDYYNILGWAFSRGKDRPASEYGKECDIFSACGGAVIYRKKVFEEIGYFEESFFAYLEDVDIGWRARLHGYRNVYAPRAKVLHVGSGASGSRHNAFKVSLSARNSILILYRNLAPWQMVVNFLPVLSGIIIKTMYFSKKHLGAEYIKGVVSGISKVKAIKRTDFTDQIHPDYVNIQKQLIINTIRRMGIKVKE